MLIMRELLELLVKRGGSDLHITAGSPPKVRLHGDLIDTEYEPLNGDDTKSIIYGVLSTEQIARFERELELDMSFGLPGIGRFRTNVFIQRGAIGAVLRVVPEKIRNFDDLALPRDLCEQLCALPKGLILVTGSTGSGKSTTLAAMIDYLNTTRQSHIVTIEDPIEFVHKHKKSLVNQREVGPDTLEFKRALRAALRQDPDVVMVGEMRDLDTIEAALNISETGHLTFSTLHTSDAALVDARRGLLPAARHALERARPHARVRDPARHSGRALPHPRGQDAPDLQHHPDQPEARHEDDERVPVRPLPRQPDHLRRGARAQQRSRRARASDPEHLTRRCRPSIANSGRSC